MNEVALKEGTRQFEDGVWRVLDIDLAIYLGYEVPRNIRKRIKRDLAALEELGEIKRSTVERLGGTAELFWLDKKQSLFVAARGETQRSDEVLIMLVDHFDAVERGVLEAPVQTAEVEVLGAERNEIARLEAKIDRTDAKVDRIGSDVTQIKSTVEHIDGNLDRLISKADEILTSQQHRRREVKFRDEMKHQACVHSRYAGICPCCHVVRIVNGDGTRTAEFEIDHYSGRHQPGLKDTWAVCHGCNMKLRDGGFHRSKYQEFTTYQNTLTAFQDPGPLFRDIHE